MDSLPTNEHLEVPNEERSSNPMPQDNSINHTGQGPSPFYSTTTQVYDQNVNYHPGLDPGPPQYGHGSSNAPSPYQHYGGMSNMPGPHPQQYMSMQQGQDYTYRPPPPPSYDQPDYRGYYQGGQTHPMYDQRLSTDASAAAGTSGTNWGYPPRTDTTPGGSGAPPSLSPGRQGSTYDTYGRDRPYGYPSQQPYDYGGYGYPSRGPSFPRPDSRYPPYPGHYPMYPGYPPLDRGYPPPERIGADEYRHMYPIGPHSPYPPIQRGPFIMDINNNDVLCGRGGATNSHVGNREFRKLVKKFKDKYLSAKKKDKPAVAAEVVEVIRKLDPPGRFLKKDKDSGYWIDIGDARAKEKTSQALREGAPLIRKQMSESKALLGEEEDDDDEEEEENGTEGGVLDREEQSSGSPPKSTLPSGDSSKLRPGLYNPGTQSDNRLASGMTLGDEIEDDGKSRKRASSPPSEGCDQEGSDAKRSKESNVDLISEFVPPRNEVVDTHTKNEETEV